MKNSPVTFTAILLILACFGLLPTPKSFGVVPPPDGGYPGGNTAEGQNALLSLTTGTFNTAVGFLSLKSNTIGRFNTAVGAGALLFNVGDGSISGGFENTATGVGALLSNTLGAQNTANGAFALFSNNDGSANTANGYQALFSNTTGGTNTAIGRNALFSNTSGSRDTASGHAALFSNTTGNANSAYGEDALLDNTTGDNNTGVGEGVLSLNTTGSENTAFGTAALQFNTTGDNNTATGFAALINTIGDHNTATGSQSLQNNTLGSFNTAAGFSALFNSTGSGNLGLGVNAGANITTASNVIVIGTAGGNVSDSCFIGNVRGVMTQNPNAIPVLIDSAGQLGTQNSSRRFKREMKPMDKASEAILALKPVTFHYKNDTTNRRQFGLIAEEVAEINPDLIVRDQSGEPLTVRYDAVNAMLLNEFLKEHKKVQQQAREIQEQKRAINRLGKTVETVIARIEEHDLKIRRVSEQIDVNQFATRRIRGGGPMPNIVSNDQ